MIILLFNSIASEKNELIVEEKLNKEIRRDTIKESDITKYHFSGRDGKEIITYTFNNEIITGKLVGYLSNNDDFWDDEIYLVIDAEILKPIKKENKDK